MTEMCGESCPCGACIDTEHNHAGGQSLHGIFCQINSALESAGEAA